MLKEDKKRNKAASKRPQKKKTRLQEELICLPIKHAVLFPGVILLVAVTRKEAIDLVIGLHKKKELLGILTQKDNEIDKPMEKDLYPIGTVARIIRIIKMPEGHLNLILEGKHSFSLQSLRKKDDILYGKVSLREDPSMDTWETQDISLYIRSLRHSFQRLCKLNPDISKEVQTTLSRITDVRHFIHYLASQLPIRVADKQEILSGSSLKEKAELLLKHLKKEVQMHELRNEIQNKTYTDIDQQQRDYFLRQQIKIMQNELGSNGGDGLESLAKKAQTLKWPKEVMEHFEKELERLRRSMTGTPEYAISLNYLEFLVHLPWKVYTKDILDLVRTEKILARNHYGISKVKDRILEYLAVMRLTGDVGGSILCLCGPPGVGKTSLGASIAEALSRRYARISLGGMGDEAEIRGHRRTYIGAMPGRIMQQISKLKTANPIIILDEIDKLHSNFRGDPSSALLEVLDPAQNHNFTDNYLEVSFDLSRVLFIATANRTETIQPALLDRLEVIEMSGYTIEEKREIGGKFLIPQMQKKHGLSSSHIQMSSAVIEKVIRNYTREAGVRELGRKLASIMRKRAREVASEQRYDSRIRSSALSQFLGPTLYERENFMHHPQIGISTGLAWTWVGGELLRIESIMYKGKGKLTLSGQLGDVMRESAMASFSYLRAHGEEWGIAEEVFNAYDIHLHIPSGAVPKDGPSAGITILCSMASLYTQCKVRDGVAMSGEITLSGQVLPVGGIKEKILAAKYGNIQEVILSEGNRKDIEALDKLYIKGLVFHYVRNAAKVLKLGLEKEKQKGFRARFPLSSNVSAEIPRASRGNFVT